MEIQEHLKEYEWYKPHLAWIGYDVGCDSKRANLSDANLSDANLSDANLSDANLSDANLSNANLIGANLSDANLSDANLSDASLSGANLRWANLRWANLSGANLRGANLSGAKYAITQTLQVSFGYVNDDLCIELMRWDAAAHPNPESFQVWADGGSCPLNTSNIRRAFLFNEVRDLYQAGPPQMTLWELWVALCEEKGIRI